MCALPCMSMIPLPSSYLIIVPGRSESLFHLFCGSCPVYLFALKLQPQFLLILVPRPHIPTAFLLLQKPVHDSAHTHILIFLTLKLAPLPFTHVFLPKFAVAKVNDLGLPSASYGVPVHDRVAWVTVGVANLEGLRNCVDDAAGVVNQILPS